MPPRRFPLAFALFLLTWALWFALPLTRPIALVRWKQKLGGDTKVSTTGNSRDAQFVRAMETGGNATAPGFTGGDARSRALETLGRRFPNDAAICAAQMVAMIDDMRRYNPRQPGPSSSGKAAWSVMLSKSQPVPPEKLRAWFAAIARGAKLDPNNTFWDWMQITGLLWAKRDAEIWPVIKAASRKTGYDDYANQGTLTFLRLNRENGPMSPVGEIAIWSATLFPQHVIMRETARETSDNAAGLRLTGRGMQALEGMRDCALMARTMRRESKSYIGSLTGIALEAIALHGGYYSPSRALTTRYSPVGSSAYARNPRSLQVFAGQMNRPDIARQAAALWSEMGVWKTKLRGILSSASAMGIGIDDRDLISAQIGEWLTLLLLAGVPWLLVLVAVCSLALRFVPAWGRDRDRRPSVMAWLWGIGLGIAGLLVLMSPIIWTVVMAWRSGSASVFDILFGSLMADGLEAVPLAWQSFFLPLTCLTGALWSAAIWNARREGKPTLGARLRRMFVAPDDDMARFDFSPLLLLLLLLSMTFLATFGVLVYLVLPTTSQNYAELHNSAGPIFFVFAAIMIVPSVIRLRSPQGRAFGLILARRFAWAQLLFLSVVWGLVVIVTAPAQKRFDAAYTRQLSVGEVQLARKKVGL